MCSITAASSLPTFTPPCTFPARALFPAGTIRPKRCSPVTPVHTPSLRVPSMIAEPRMEPATPAPAVGPVPHIGPSIQLDPHAFWNNRWYPVAFSADVPAGKLYSFKLFDRPYVLFLDAATSIYVAADDVCPHRAVPLSEGRLLNRQGQTVLECAYHGWQFSCSGKCTAIPAAGPDFSIPTTANISTLYATKVGPAGLIFFFPGDRLIADDIPLPLPPILREPDWESRVSIFKTFSRELPIPFELLVENIVDPMHVHFAHHRADLFFNRKFVDNTTMHVDTHDPSVGEIRWHTKRTWGRTAGSWMTGGGTTICLRPFESISIMIHAVPTSREVTTIVMYNAFRDAPKLFAFLRPRVPRWIDHASLHVVLDGDTAFLRTTDNYLRMTKQSWRDTYMLANGTYDCAVVIWRRWFERFEETMPFLKPKGMIPFISKTEINDRMKWHVEKCTSCKAVLRNFRGGRVAAIAVGIVMLATAISAGIVMTVFVQAGMKEGAARIYRVMRMAAVVAVVAVVVGKGCDRGVRSMTFSDASRRFMEPDDAPREVKAASPGR